MPTSIDGKPYVVINKPPISFCILSCSEYKIPTDHIDTSKRVNAKVKSTRGQTLLAKIWINLTSLNNPFISPFPSLSPDSLPKSFWKIKKQMPVRDIAIKDPAKTDVTPFFINTSARAGPNIYASDWKVVKIDHDSAFFRGGWNLSTKSYLA